MLLVGESCIVWFREENRRFLTKSRSLLTPLSVVQMLSFGDSRPDDEAGRVVVGVFDVGGGVAESKDWRKIYKTFYDGNLPIFEIS